MSFSAITRLVSRDWWPISLAQAVALFCGLAGVHLTTRWVTPEDAGAYGLFLSFVPAGAMLSHAGLVRHFARHWATAPDGRHYLLAWCRAAIWPAGLLLVAMAAIMTLGFVGPTGLWMFGALLVGAVGSVVAQAMQAGVQSSARYWTDCGLSVYSAITRSFFPLALLFFLGGGLSALTGGFVLHTVTHACLALGIVLALSKRAEPGNRSKSNGTSLGSYQVYFLFSGALNLLNLGIVRWSASLAFDPVTLGHITIAANLAAVGPSMLSVALWQFVYPRMLASQREQAGGTIRKLAATITAAYVACGLAGGGLLALLLPVLPGTLISARYLPALPFVLPLFAFYMGLCGLTLLQGEFVVQDRPRAALLWMAAGTTVFAGPTLVLSLLDSAKLIAWWWISPLVGGVPLWLGLRRYGFRSDPPKNP